ncbi:MAG: hypothetical protein QM487_04430 [Candidatus Marithrix sp.]
MKTIKKISILFLIAVLPYVSFASIEVVGSLRHINKGSLGDTYKGEIKIQNSGDNEQEVRIYQTDLLYNFEDFTFYNDPVSHNRSNANWIQFSPKTTIVAGNSTTYVQYEVTIPKSDTVIGTYWSVLMIEGINPIDPNQEGEFNINTVTRYAIQIVTEITDRGVGKLVFSDPSLITEGDQLFLAVDITNTGEHYIVPEMSMELFDETGESVKVLVAPKKGLFPTTSARYRFNLEGLKSEKTYQTVIIAAGEGDDVFGLEYTLFF